MSTVTTNGVATESPRATRPTPVYGAEKPSFAGAGWVLFAAIMFVVAASLNIIWGIAAVSSSHFFVANAHYILGGLNTWGWIAIVFGAVELTGRSVDLEWGRVRAVVRGPGRRRQRRIGDDDDPGVPVLVADAGRDRLPGDLRPRRVRGQAGTDPVAVHRAPPGGLPETARRHATPKTHPPTPTLKAAQDHHRRRSSCPALELTDSDLVRTPRAAAAPPQLVAEVRREPRRRVVLEDLSRAALRSS